LSYKNEKLEEFEKYIAEKKVAIIGMGVSNIPLLDYFQNLGAKVSVFDNKEYDKIDTQVINKISSYCMGMSFGKDYLSKLKGFDIIFRSPSCRPDTKELLEESQRGALVTSEIEMLMKLTPATVIGVTGSDGKTTTTSLIYEIIKEKGYKCFLGGNIGIPLFTKVKEMKPEDVVVLELSSFQLMDMDISPNISVVTNVSPNHLDIHKCYEEYIEAKANIFKFQKENNILVLNYDNDITRNFAKRANGKVKFFSSKTKLENGVIYDDGMIKSCEDGIRRHIINTNNIFIKGVHNYENICAAICATASLVDVETQNKAISNFKGVEHRIEFVREIDGVKWYNDSIGTSPTRTIAGLNSFNEKIVLIAGGYDKHLDYTPIAKPIVDHVSTLILVGATSKKIYSAVNEELEAENKTMDIYQCETLDQTVEMAYKLAKPGEVVFFSPASASFDMFKNFAERGNKFKELVNNI